MKAITFYHSNISPLIIGVQKSVFDYFNIPILQIHTEQTHGNAIDLWLKENLWNEIAVFDIDCIPLNPDVIVEAFLKINKDRNTLYGAAQKANHIEGSDIYCSPAFSCFTREIWEKSGMATFQDIQWHDVGSFFSSECKRVGNINLIFPSHVEVPKWDLRVGEKFGNGTTYANEVYHAFECRFNKASASRFINKCREVVNG